MDVFPPDGCLTLAAIPNSVPLARRLVVEQLRHWGLSELIDSAEVIISELMTNALRATREIRGRNVHLRLVWDEPTFGIEVMDSNPQLPIKRQAGEFDISGRGLELVDALASDWGAYYFLEGKSVWASIKR